MKPLQPGYKYVIVRECLDLLVQVPESATAEDVNTHRNVSDWCAKGIAQEILDSGDEQDCRICSWHMSEFVREATPMDVLLRSGS